jgi:hypothetical protein
MSVFLNQSHTNNITPLLVPIAAGNGATGPTGPTGPNGPLLNMRGTVPTASSLPGGASLGDAYVALDTGDIWTWVGTLWFNSGQFDGPQGTIGIAGVTGATGPIGPAGNAGIAGLFGQVGIQGTTGPTGLQGQIGQIGPQGNAGIVGPAGPIGLGDSLSSSSASIPQNVFFANIAFPPVWVNYYSVPADPDVVKSGHILVVVSPFVHRGQFNEPLGIENQSSVLYKIVGHNFASSPGTTTKWLSTPSSYGNINVPYRCENIVIRKGVDYDETTTQFDFFLQMGVNSFNNFVNLTISPDYGTGLTPGNFKMTFLGLP